MVGHFFYCRGIISTNLLKDFEMIYIPNIKALFGSVFRCFFENCNFKSYFLTLLPTYATNQNWLNNFGRRLSKDHSCKFGKYKFGVNQKSGCKGKYILVKMSTDEA